jgi:hypothetical protein
LRPCPHGVGVANCHSVIRLPRREVRRVTMVRDGGPRHALPASRSRSGCAVRSVLKGRSPTGTRRLISRDRPTRQDRAYPTSSQRPTSARRVGAYTQIRKRKNKMRFRQCPIRNVRSSSPSASPAPRGGPGTDLAEPEKVICVESTWKPLMAGPINQDTDE